MRQLEGEEQVRQLALRVRGPPVVASVLPGDVVEVDVAGPVGAAGDRDHAGPFRRPQQWQEQAGQGEVPKVVGADLQLETVDGAPRRRVHDTGVVDEHVQGPHPGGHVPGRGPDGGEIGQVQVDRFRRRSTGRRGDPRAGASGPLGRATGDEHARPGA